MIHDKYIADNGYYEAKYITEIDVSEQLFSMHIRHDYQKNCQD